MKLLSFPLLLSLFFSLFFVRPILAQTFIDSITYEITPGIPDTPVGSDPIFLTKEFDINYNKGPVILSWSPDGTMAGWIIVDDGLTIAVTQPNGTEGVFKKEYHLNCSIRHQGVPEDISSLFSKGVNRVKVTLYDICGLNVYSDPLYLVTEKPDPVSEGPQPFLDLPWDYGNKHFNEVIFNPNSWFDHNGPLQNYKCCIQEALNYKGQANMFYKSHSGYDYGFSQGVDKNTLVLAAADGKATFKHKDHSGGAGNMIIIDHGNGYQTWYEHLEEATPGSRLIVREEGIQPQHVHKGEIIGRVGLTGNTTNYHIHLSVFKDVNNNSTFDDDYPIGLVDPLGWEGDYPDPWEEYTQGDKHGAKSYKLFTGLTPPTTQQLPPSGGSVSKEELTIKVPENASDESLTYKIVFGPFEKASEIIKSITPTLLLSAANDLGLLISHFNNPLLLTYDYSKVNLENINEDSLSFYFFNEETKVWEKIQSTIDKTNKTISAPTTHFSQYTVMGEQLDSFPPETTAQITGTKGKGNWYLSDVTVSLLAKDNEGGKGVSYTVYSLDGENWQEYKTPLNFNEERSYRIYFLSHDTVGNDETQKSVEFSIDKTPPEVKIEVDQTLWDLKISPTATDSSLTKKPAKKPGDITYFLTDPAGNNLTLETSALNTQVIDLFKLNSLKYNSQPKIQIPENLLDVNYIFYTPKKRPEIKIINQNFTLKDQAVFVIAADAIKNKTILNILENKKLRKEEKPGLTLLKLQTNKGKLEYSY